MAVLSASGASAQTEHDGPLPEGQDRRAAPEYDGRLEPGPDAVDVALWFPRILFAPLYVVTEYLIRRPLALVFYELERHRVLIALPRVFTFFPDGRAGIVPTALFDFGFRPSIGVYAFWNRFLHDGSRISLHAATGGTDWLTLSAGHRFEATTELALVSRFNALRRPDQLFGGIGWTATQNVPGRFALDQIDASLRFEQRPWRRTALDYHVGYRSASFESARYGDDLGVAELGPSPAGFAEGYSSFRFGASALLDTRELRELADGGVSVGAFVEHHLAFGGVPVSRWLRWGGSLLLATDFLGQGRVLSIGAQAQLITPLHDGSGETVVPFTELIDLGGDQGPMRAFRPGHVRGYSIAVVQVTYLWPVWVLLDAYLRASVGNAFDAYLEDFALERLRLAFDIGVRPRTAGDHPFELLVGLGTETFGGGTSVVSVRVTIGARAGL